jgi:hypothetical protein
VEFLELGKLADPIMQGFFTEIRASTGDMQSFDRIIAGDIIQHMHVPTIETAIVVEDRTRMFSCFGSCGYFRASIAYRS